MDNFDIESAVKATLRELSAGNCFGEPVLLVAATKTRTPEEISRAIAAGVTAVGENKVQEFRDKYGLIHGAEKHFIGHLQTNKIKYLLGKCDLIHSVDRDELIDALDAKLTAPQDVLIQINIGCELSKGGYPLEKGLDALAALKGTKLRPRGFMAMLPIGEESELIPLAKEMRALYDQAKKSDPAIRYLSMGMGGDWRLCVRCGSNMVRLGTSLFGAR